MSGEKLQRNTHQKTAILDYMKAHRDSHIRAEDIISDLQSQGENCRQGYGLPFFKGFGK